MKAIKKAIKATLVCMMAGSALYAQTLAEAKKAIDAEQYQKAKGILKTLIKTQPTAENYFHLGNIYLKTDYPDSAKTFFTSGVNADPKSPLNYIGLGAADLASNNAASAKANFALAEARIAKKDAKPYVYIGRAYARAPKPDYNSAVTYFGKAKAMNDKDAEVYLGLADTHRDMRDASSAYAEYRSASDLDRSMLRSKVELAVLNRSSGAFQESVDVLNSVVSADPNYGPAYRELAETYYRWGNSDVKNYDTKIKQSLAYYEKYMDLTDRSLDSRMRHADFLVLTRDYKTLQQEAQAMSQLDRTNPRVFRYLGYSAFENANYPATVQALKDFKSRVDSNRLIAQDYLYLGRAQMKTGETVDGLNNLKKAIKLDSTTAGVMSEIAKGLYDAKKYSEAEPAYELSLKNPKAAALDYYYLGNSYYFDYFAKVKTDPNTNKDMLVKADSAFSKLLQRAPTTEVALLYRARIQRAKDDSDDSKGLAVPFFEQYVQLVTVARPEKAEKSKAGLLEAYTYLGSVAARKDKDNAKALDYFNKGLALDPANATLQQAKKAVSPGK